MAKQNHPVNKVMFPIYTPVASLYVEMSNV